MHPAKMSKVETIADWHAGKGKYKGAKDAAIEKAYRDTALDGGKGEIISIAWKVGRQVKSVYEELGTGDKLMIETAFDCIDRECNKNPPYFIGHNIPWDLAFLWKRAVILGIKPPFKLPFGGRHKSDFYDNSQAWAGYNKRISQDDLCKVLGIEGKPDDINGSKVWDFVKAGKVERVREYNEYDVSTVETIWKRLNFKQ